MTDRHDRLVRCFSAVFPRLPAAEIPASRIENVEEWDSLAAVRLLAVVEEEFGVHPNLRDLQDFLSFEAFDHYLQNHIELESHRDMT